MIAEAQKDRMALADKPPKVPPLRVLQVAVAAAFGLLFLKGVGIATHGSYIFAGSIKTEEAGKATNAATQIARAASEDDGLITGATGHDKKDEGHGAKPAAKPEAGGEKELKTASDFKPQEKPAPPQVSPSELKVLQRLRERRDNLEQRAQELDLRENLLNATEKKFEDRIGDVKPASAQEGQSARPVKEGEHIKTLVTIYENMKPKDAARVFDRLDMRILVSVILSMNPRKVSEVLAAMSPDVAEKLTVAMATRPRDGDRGADDGGRGDLPAGELPRVDLPPRP